MIGLAQSGSDVAVTYGQFLSGLTGVPNLDASGLLVTPTGGQSPATLADLTASLLPASGGTMTGPLALAADPTAPGQAATKSYVDTEVGTALPKAGGSVTGPLTLAADPSQPSQAATKNYVDTKIAGALPRTGGTLTGALLLSSDPASPLQAATKDYVDLRVLRAGDTLTGPLQLASDPTTALQAATKNYVDSQSGKYLAKTGGTLTGALLLAGDPGASLQAATKQYVDQRVSRSGDTLTGPLTLASDPTTALQASTKNYVDTQLGTALLRSGGTLSGSLTLSADPTTPLQAATKHYTDTQVSSALPLSGGTLTGPLALSAAPALGPQAANKQYVDAQDATRLPLAGGTLTGSLTLSANPTSPLHAATKQYVDANPGPDGYINVKLPPYNAKIDGVTDDTAAFKAAYQAAPTGSVIYVPNGVTVLQPPSSWGVPLTDRVKWIVDGTTLPDGTQLSDGIATGNGPSSMTLPGIVVGNSGVGAVVSQGHSQPTDFAVLHSSYVVSHNGGPSPGVITNTRNDTIIYNSPNNYVWGGLDRFIWAGVQTPNATTRAQHVGRYVQAIRQQIGTDSNGQPLPQPQLWTACLEYRDATGHPSSWASDSIVVEMDWFGNGADDATSRQIQSLVVGQNDTSGAPVEVSTIVGVYLAAGSTGHTRTVFAIGIPFSSAVLDTTYALQLPGASAIRLAAGHSIAFDSSNSNYLVFDKTTGTLRWNQGALSYVVGKGISVGWQTVCTGNTTLQSSAAGNVVFLIGSGAYTVSLPAANTLAAGTGYTFSNLGSASVSLLPNGSDGIDWGPIVLHPNDRYHIVSDGGTTWREIFRTNFMSPRFGGPPTLPSYIVSALPGGMSPGAKAYAANGRKPNEAPGGGTGVEVFFDGSHWISACTGTTVAA
ncbi:MAG TPA: glycosyl hydrolase family 28-related protein [Acetobacteraceae bacterium]|nr:glycosyl hydrolase family 28-related protein [Acetobacteraceae bacterium]